MIAVVDDDASVRDALVDLMASLGLAAESFANAEAFLGSVEAGNSDCLIADIQMPGMSGLDLVKRLTDSGRPVPTILITAYPSERIRKRALQAGVVKFLAKPFRNEELIASIQTILDGASAVAQSRRGRKHVTLLHPVESDRNYFLAVLRDQGYDVDLAQDADDLVAGLRARRADLVLVHAMRLDALFALKAVSELANIPAAVISSYAQGYVEDRLRIGGVTVPTVPVPISAADLADTIARCMR